MKKTLLGLVLLFALSANSQPYVGIMATTQGMGFSVGVVTESMADISVGFNTPISTKVYVPLIAYMKAGCQYPIGKFTITPAIGGAYWMKTDISQWAKGGDVKRVQDLKFIASLEFGKDINSGRLFTNLSFCGNLFAGAGIKAFIR